MGAELETGGKGRVGVDLESDATMSAQVGLHESRSNPGERVKYSLLVSGDVPRERVVNEVF